MLNDLKDSIVVVIVSACGSFYQLYHYNSIEKAVCELDL